MAKGKSPGSDGLPIEFYAALWDFLGEDLVNVFNASGGWPPAFLSG